MKISKQFVTVGDRRVLVRHAGHGPALVLLHQSPQNSRAMIPWIERLAANYAVFAPDTPAFGESDPLPLSQPEIPDYAAAVAKLLDRLGIERAILFGVHTGAVIALRTALDFPEKVVALVCDGYARFSTTEREALLAHYLPPFEPTWDGSHLIWLLARMREQHLFFPWHDHSQPARLSYPSPAPAHLHDDVMHLLDAGDSYRTGYRAPFLYDDATAAARLKVPAHIYYRAEDVLAPHLQRLPLLPSHVMAETVRGGPSALVAKADAVFAAHAAGATALDAGKCVEAAKAAGRSILATPEGDLGYRLVAGCGSEVVLHLHDIGSPVCVPVTRELAAITVLPDLPGHGASRDWPHEHCSPDRVAIALLALLDSLGLDRVSIFAVGGSGAIGAELAKLLGARAARLTLQNPLSLNAAERGQFLELLPDLTPTSAGSHLMAAWNFARLKYLFWPWLPQDGQAARQVMAPSPRRVHSDVVEIFRAGACFHALWRDVLTPDMARLLSQLAIPVDVLAAPEHEYVRLATRLAASAGLLAADTTGPSDGWKSWHK